jgi:hypothetical protein
VRFSACVRACAAQNFISAGLHISTIFEQEHQVHCVRWLLNASRHCLDALWVLPLPLYKSQSIPHSFLIVKQ